MNKSQQDDLTGETRHSVRQSHLGKLGFRLSFVPLVAIALLFVLQPG